MNKLALILFLGLSFSSANATTLSSTATGDDVFRAYLSPDANSIDGLTEIKLGSIWALPTTTTETEITSTTPLYLIIQAINIGGGPGGFLGNFSLSDSNYSFSNGLQTINTGVAGWTMYVNSLSNSASEIVTQGKNGLGPWGPWFPEISSEAQWVWYYNSSAPGSNDNSTVYFVTSISPTTVPLPGAVWLMGSALLGFIGYKRRTA